MDSKNRFLIVVTALALGVGCAKENKSGAPGAPEVTCDRTGTCVLPATPTPPPPGSTPAPGYDSGSSASLILDGGAPKLAQMFYSSNPNNPTNVRINIDLRRQSDAIIISYQEGGRTYEAALGTQHPYSGVSNNMHNGWISQNSKLIWKGFFQDTYGAVVLVVDRAISQGDGRPPDILGGSIWFQNFNRYYPNYPQQGPLKMCWEITMGPYDCRTYINNGQVDVRSALYPNNRGPNANMDYVKLGDFDGIDRNAAGF